MPIQQPPLTKYHRRLLLSSALSVLILHSVTGHIFLNISSAPDTALMPSSPKSSALSQNTMVSSSSAFCDWASKAVTDKPALPALPFSILPKTALSAFSSNCAVLCVPAQPFLAHYVDRQMREVKVFKRDCHDIVVVLFLVPYVSKSDFCIKISPFPEYESDSYLLTRNYYKFNYIYDIVTLHLIY